MDRTGDACVLWCHAHWCVESSGKKEATRALENKTLGAIYELILHFLRVWVPVAAFPTTHLTLLKLKRNFICLSVYKYVKLPVRLFS